MEWNQDLTVGVRSLDAQHAKLIALINKLHDAMRAGSGQKVVAAVLDELIAYTRDHFTYEEQLMRRAGYPDVAAHAAEHAALTADVRKLQKDLADGSLLTMDVMSFLRTWLTTHIMQKDARYGACLQQARID